MTLPPDTPDDGPTIPARFRVYPEPEVVMIGKMALALAFVAGAIAGLVVGWAI